MANRNFRKNLALLCALAGGATALNSINIPTSAMEIEKFKTMEQNIDAAVLQFKEQYNYWKQVAGPDQKTQDNLTKSYEYLTCKEAATILTKAITNTWERKRVVIMLNNAARDLEYKEDAVASMTIKMLNDRLSLQKDIQWSDNKI